MSNSVHKLHAKVDLSDKKLEPLKAKVKLDVKRFSQADKVRIKRINEGGRPKLAIATSHTTNSKNN